MNLIRWITSKLRRKPLLVKPDVNNRFFSKLSLETAYLQGYVDAFGRTSKDDWKVLFAKFYEKHFPE